MEFEVVPEIARLLGARYELRALRQDDHEKGFLECLSDLTIVGQVTKADYEGKLMDGRISLF